MMTMINTAKEGLQDQLRKNDAVREEERDLAAEDVESIPSDNNSDSKSSGTTSKPASSSSKETREQNAIEETNPNKISKEQNELKMKEVREFAAYTATVQYHLNLHVIGLNYSSTYVEMITRYRSMARRFHPDNNYGFDNIEMMKMINTAKEGLQDQLRKNDAVREEERDLAAKDVESIPSDHNYDSESSGTSSKPASSHPQPWTSKKSLKNIKKLHIRCDGIGTFEHLYILPSIWISLLKYDIIGDAIHSNFLNACCTPIIVFVDEHLGSWHPKTHGPRNYLQSFYLAALIHKCREKNQYPYAEIRIFFCRHKDKIISERK